MVPWIQKTSFLRSAIFVATAPSCSLHFQSSQSSLCRLWYIVRATRRQARRFAGRTQVGVRIATWYADRSSGRRWLGGHLCWHRRKPWVFERSPATGSRGTPDLLRWLLHRKSQPWYDGRPFWCGQRGGGTYVRCRRKGETFVLSPSARLSWHSEWRSLMRTCGVRHVTNCSLDGMQTCK